MSGTFEEVIATVDAGDDRGQPILAKTADELGLT
jgi:hypothetical protein